MLEAYTVRQRDTNLLAHHRIDFDVGPWSPSGSSQMEPFGLNSADLPPVSRRSCEGCSDTAQRT